MYNVWLDKPRFDDAERMYQEHLQMLRTGGCSTGVTCVSSHQTTVSILILLFFILEEPYSVYSFNRSSACCIWNLLWLKKGGSQSSG